MSDSLVKPLSPCSRGVKVSGRSNKKSLVSPAHISTHGDVHGNLEMADLRFKHQLDKVIQRCPGTPLWGFFRSAGAL